MPPSLCPTCREIEFRKYVYAQKNFSITLGSWQGSAKGGGADFVAWSAMPFSYMHTCRLVAPWSNSKAQKVGNAASATTSTMEVGRKLTQTNATFKPTPKKHALILDISLLRLGAIRAKEKFCSGPCGQALFLVERWFENVQI
jgi:hypothetical protein